MSQDKIHGMLFGVALGDALGVPHEFRHNKKNVYTGKLQYHPSMRNRFTGKETMFPIGTVSDDTEMTISLFSSMKRKDSSYYYDSKDALKSYLAWANDGMPKMMGVNTRKLFKGVKTLKGYENRAKKVFSSEISQSNGCLMRCSPLALIEDAKERMVSVESDCKLTNPTSICIEVCKVYVEGLRMALMGSHNNDIILHMSKVEHKELQHAVVQVLNNIPREITSKSKGWIVHAFYCVLYSLYHFTSYSEAVNSVIKMGGDTDTNAAIVGGMFGALIGLNLLRKEQKDNLELMLKTNNKLFERLDLQ